MYVGLKQPRGDGERCVTPARAAAKETSFPCTQVPFSARPQGRDGLYPRPGKGCT